MRRIRPLRKKLFYIRFILPILSLVVLQDTIQIPHINQRDILKIHTLEINDIELKKQEFINQIVVILNEIYLNIAQERHYLTRIINRVTIIGDRKNYKWRLFEYEWIWIQKISKKYDRKWDINLSLLGNIKDLLSRVDIVPIPVVIIQAAVESGWGTSRFAIEGNNLFGVHCYDKGCGISPLGHKVYNFEVKKYISHVQSILDYLHILNTKEAYDDFRIARAHIRSNKGIINSCSSALEILPTLINYSTKGREYTNLLKKILSSNLHLSKLCSK